MVVEPILEENRERFVLFPIKHREIWEMYKKAEASFWTAEEIDLARDVVDWESRLTADEKNFVKHVLAFYNMTSGGFNQVRTGTGAP